jgi:hypothetical protein
MMDESNPFNRSPFATEPVAEAPREADVEQPAKPTEVAADASQAPATDGTTTPMPDAATLDASAAVMKFKSCRWRSDPEAGEFCTHRDVLPFAGKAAFNPESWCPECAFYKLRRTPKKRERVDFSY